MRLLPLGGPLLALALLASCGDGAEPAPPASGASPTPAGTATRVPTATPTTVKPAPFALASLDPCTLISADEARGLTGRPMAAPQRVNVAGRAGWADCAFNATSGQARVVVSVSNLSQDAAGLVESLKVVQGGGEARGVSGLGDVAFTNDRAVAVLKGQRGVQFLVVPAPADTSALLAFIRTVLLRIP